MQTKDELILNLAQYIFYEQNKYSGRNWNQLSKLSQNDYCETTKNILNNKKIDILNYYSYDNSNGAKELPQGLLGN